MGRGDHGGDNIQFFFMFILATSHSVFLFCRSNTYHVFIAGISYLSQNNFLRCLIFPSSPPSPHTTFTAHFIGSPQAPYPNKKMRGIQRVPSLRSGTC